MILQLLKTTPYLSGQVKLDLVADRLSGDSTIYVDELHVVPISDSIWVRTDEDQLNNHHSDNIMSLYSRMMNDFYTCIPDAMLSGKIPYYSVDDTPTDTCDHTYQMGLRRQDRSRYDKEVSFLLPMWIDSADYIDNLDFFIHVDGISDNETERNTTNELVVKKVDISSRLREYLKEYLAGVSSDLLYIGLNNHSAYLTGLDVTSGTVLTRDVSDITNALSERERPIIETDDMLARLFQENHIIARQLINFNICFNISDLFSTIINNQLLWSQFNIWVEARLKDVSGVYQDIPLKDIYTNYTDIFSYKLSNSPLMSGEYVASWKDTSGQEHHFNVLDYLKDDKCVDIIHTNKMTQPDVHWAFADNEMYTWNLYDGYAPIVVQQSNVTDEDLPDNLIVKHVSERFFSTPDMISRDYDIYRNNAQWMTVIDGTRDIIPASYVSMMMNEGSTTLFAPNQFGQCWSRGIKYNIKDILAEGITYDDKQFTSNGIYANMCVLRSTAQNHLDSSKVYCAVYRQKQNDIYKDFISIVFITSGDIDADTSKNTLGLMTFQNIRSMLSGLSRITASSESEYHDVMDFINVDTSAGEFKNLFVLKGVTVDHRNDMSGINLLSLFYNVLNTIEYPKQVRFDRSVAYRQAPGPIVNHSDNEKTGIEYLDEIEYVKLDNNYSSQVFRYDGNIIPQFIDPELPPLTTDTEDLPGEWTTSSTGMFNKIYRLRQWNELTLEEQDRFNNITLQCYDPDYPSLDYFYLIGDNVKLNTPLLPAKYRGEVCWFRNNKIYYTDKQFTETVRIGDTAECEYPSINAEVILDVFINHVIQYGYFNKIDDRDVAKDIIRHYIWPQYTYTYNWEYTSLTDINDYTFTIEYTLK